MKTIKVYENKEELERNLNHIQFIKLNETEEWREYIYWDIKINPFLYTVNYEYFYCVSIRVEMNINTEEVEYYLWDDWNGDFYEITQTDMISRIYKFIKECE